MLTPGLVAPAKPAAASSGHKAPSKPAHKAFTTLPVIDVSALLDCSRSQVLSQTRFVSCSIAYQGVTNESTRSPWMPGHTESPATGG